MKYIFLGVKLLLLYGLASLSYASPIVQKAFLVNEYSFTLDGAEFPVVLKGSDDCSWYGKAKPERNLRVRLKFDSKICGDIKETISAYAVDSRDGRAGIKAECMMTAKGASHCETAKLEIIEHTVVQVK